MEAKLFERLKESMVQFNDSAVIDITEGKYLGGNVTFAPYPSKTGPNYAIIAKWMVAIEKLKPNTTERWIAATNLLRYMGYSVTWKGEDVCPAVYWINTEGNGADEAKMIDDILNRDYTLEPKIDIAQLNGEEFYTKMREVLNCWTKPIIICDSISQDSTQKS